MNGCISTNLDVVPNDSPQLTVYGLRLRARSQDDNGSRVGERVSCVLILTLNSVGWAQLICEAHVMLG